MNAYNPVTGQTIEISEYGFQMLEAKGWKRAVDQSPRKIEPPLILPATPPVFDMKAEMEKKRLEVEAKKKEIVPATIVMLDEVKTTTKPKTTKPKANPGKVTGTKKANN